MTPSEHRPVRQALQRAAAIGSTVGLTALSVTALSTAALAPAAHAATTDYADTPLQMVPGMMENLRAATMLSAAPTDRVLSISVAVAGADPAAATQLAAQQQDPSSPEYHQWLTPAAYAQAFGVPADREAAIVSWLGAAGFSVNPQSSSGLVIGATATVGQVESLFRVDESSFTFDGTPFVANDEPPQVPSGLGIVAVSGLDTFRKMTTFNHVDTSLTPADRAALVTKAHDEAASVPDVNAPIVATQVAQPRDLWSIYDEPSTDLGQGETSGIFGEGETDSVITQLRLFESAEGFPKVPVKVIRTEGNVTDDADYGDNTGSIEWYLDSQAMTGMAPDLAQLDLYFSKTLYDPDILQSFEAWQSDPNGPTQMNASFGECETSPGNEFTGPLSQEPYGTELGDELEPSAEPVLQAATMEGRTLFASAGDTGSGCPEVVVPVAGAGNGVAPSPAPIVNYPAASEHVVGVGGTVLTYTPGTAATGDYTQAGFGAGSGATRTAEGSWTDTGGGASHYLAEPTFQTGVKAVRVPCTVMPDGTPYPVTVGSPTPPTCRGVPDIADLSGNITGNAYFIYIDGSPSSEGGTSLSSPLAVGMWSRIQAASSKVTNGVTGLGFAAPALYSLYDYDTKVATGTYGKDFFDVTQEESGTTNGAYSPVPGWDYTSGLGVMDVAHIMDDLDASEAARSSAVPAEAPPVAACTATEFSPVGNATNAFEVQLPNDTGLDLTKTVFSTDAVAKTVSVAITGPDFTSPDAQDIEGQDFRAQWLYDGTVYFIDDVVMDGTPATPTDGNNTGAAGPATTAPTASLSADGSTLTLTAPFADVGLTGSVAGAKLRYPSVDARNATELSTLIDSASAENYVQQSVGQAVQVAPCTVEAVTPTSALPESPVDVLLPLAGGAVIFGVVRRRRRRGGAARV